MLLSGMVLRKVVTKTCNGSVDYSITSRLRAARSGHSGASCVSIDRISRYRLYDNNGRRAAAGQNNGAGFCL